MLNQREIGSRWFLGALAKEQSCFGPRLGSKTGGIFLKMEDLTGLLSGIGSEEELSFQEELWLDLSGSAIRGQRLPAALPQGVEFGLHSGL